ncbi:hypothetical protein ACFFX0_11070 [Citricoccus parietis]|uniref:Uncharacterized protein n=1 Tax=Citricoccus parietis TaxID=592307 RepID=A0ABV5FYF9_9MICC
MRAARGAVSEDRHLRRRLPHPRGRAPVRCRTGPDVPRDPQGRRRRGVGGHPLRGPAQGAHHRGHRHRHRGK